MRSVIVNKKSLNDLISISEASQWASNFLNKDVTNSNIGYLIQYALIKKFDLDGYSKVSLSELKKYYKKYKKNNTKKWDNNAELNWGLSFDNYKESETTKHVNRLHPYKGKFIPQLVEYFLDSHTDSFKKDAYFQKGDIILDPFCGSGTTLIQANELEMHAIGVDISIFNTLISNCKARDINIEELKNKISSITDLIQEHYNQTGILLFENELLEKLIVFNKKYFPNYEYKSAVRNKTIEEKSYSKEKEKIFLAIYLKLINKYNIDIKCISSSFIDKWFLPNIRKELYLVRDFIENSIVDENIKKVLLIILSRTMRSCRATTHSDLATLLEPVTVTYYCTKHYKICKPLFSLNRWWKTYSKDTLKRINDFKQLRTNTHQICLAGDSRNIDLYNELESRCPELSNLLMRQKISGIFVQSAICRIN